MKSSTITLAVTLALSSSSSVSAMPRYHDSMSYASLSARAPAHWIKRSLLDGRSAGYTPEFLLKRGTENRNGQPSSLAKRGESDDGGDDGDDGDDDDGDDDDCDDPSDADEHVKSLGASHYNKIASSATNTRGSTSSSSQSNSYYQHAQPSEEQTPNYSKSESPQKWVQSSTQASKVTKLLPQKGSSSSQSHSTFSSSHVQYGGSYGASQPSGSEPSYHGKATFFSQDSNPGACGKTHQDSDYIVAIQSEMYGGGKFCGKTILVTRKSTGHSIKCIAADECPGCPTEQSLDLSIGAFNALGNPEEGVFDISWEVME